MIPLRKKDPNAVAKFHIIWCDPTGLNDGSVQDRGFLQGATISTSAWTPPSGITEDSENKDAVDIGGVSFAANTVATVVMSGGTAGTTYTLLNRITTSDGRTQDQSLKIQVEEM